MAKGWAYVNGKVCPLEQATVPVMDHGFLYGDSVYETLRTYGGRPFLVEPHLDRLAASAAGLGLQPALSLPQLATDMDVVLERAGYPDSVIRIIWSRGVGELGYDPDEAQSPGVVVLVKPLTEFPPSYYEQGLRVAVVDVRRNPVTSLDPRLKTSNLLNQRMAYMDARRRQADEAILLTQAGTLAEGSRTNLFVVDGDTLCTPPVDIGILNGVTRRLVLQLARTEGQPVVERTLAPETLQTCTEVFMTGTTMGLVPVTSVDGRRVGTGAPGPITRRLLQAFWRFVQSPPWQLEPGVTPHR